MVVGPVGAKIGKVHANYLGRSDSRGDIIKRSGEAVSRQQYAFVIGVLLVWLAWAAGWVVLAAVAAGLIGVLIVRVIAGEVDLDDLTERVRSFSSRSENDVEPKIRG